MMTCPACGKENEDSAFECKRCRAPLREEVPEEHAPEQAPAQVEAAPVEPEASSHALGMVCSRCEAYNEPGVRNCTNCGYQLRASAPGGPPAHAGEASLDKTPRHASPHDVTPPDGISSLSEELSALAISDAEAAVAGISTASSGNGAEAGPPLDRTPPHPFVLPEQEEPVRADSPARSRKAELAAAAASVAAGALVGIASSRRAPEQPPAPPAKAPEPVAAPAEKLCSSCNAANPPAAKFCFDCGTPFAKKAPATKPPGPVWAAPPAEPVRAAPPHRPPPPAVRIEPTKVKAAAPPPIQGPPSIVIDEDLTDSTAESAAVSLDEPLPEELPFEAAALAEPLPEEAPPEELAAEEAFEEVPPPFPASLVVEKGAAQGTTFLLARLENSVGASGAHIELGEDPFVAPHAATLLFAEDHLAVRDEGSANGVFVKVRESAPLEPGDLFVAGERLFRYEGAVELVKNGEGDTPFLGAPRPLAAAVRVSEVLSGGNTGRTCHRSGPVIAIGRTGCDLNFPADALLAARHAEIRIAEDGSAALVDLGAGPSGAFVRLRTQAQHQLQAGDVLRIGEHLLRLEVG